MKRKNCNKQVYLSSLFTLCVLIISMYASTPTYAASKTSPLIDTITQQVITNISQNGWNPNAQFRGVTIGGLYVNWKMDDPSQTNASVDSSGDNSHDPQTDLYYLNALAEYKSLHPTDTTFNNEINRILQVVNYEFANYNLPKGWIYFYLLRDAYLLGNLSLMIDAYNAAYNYYHNWYSPSIGIVYNHTHLPGVYSTEHTLTSGAALIDAGLRWNQPAWVQAGRSTIDNALTASFNPQYNLLYNNMIVYPDGTQAVDNAQSKSSTEGSAVEALVNAYVNTGNQHYLDVAYQLMQSLFNTSGLWDQTYGGLFFARELDTGKLDQRYKETRAQAHVLIGLYRYNMVMQMLGRPQAFLDKQQQLISLLSNNFYQSTYHGYFYRVTPDFQIYTSKPGQGIGYEDYFTTEAMGLALDSLQQSQFPYRLI